MEIGCVVVFYYGRIDAILDDMIIKERNTLVAAGVALLFIGASLYFANSSGNIGGDSQKQVESAHNERAQIPKRDSATLGKDNAKVVLIEFVDFQCPSCATFHFGAGSVLFEKYIKTGLVKMIYKHFPLLGEESFAAAYASECAGDQGKFWEYHNYLFEQQTKSAGENSGTFSASNLVRYAEALELRKDMFASCLNSEKYKDRVVRDLTDGKNANVTGTPTVFINGKKIEGAAHFTEYQKIIEEELKR